MADDLAILQFESRLKSALERVRVVLDANKAPNFAGDVHHQYDDKYFLAECMTNAAAASQLNCLSFLGLGAESVAKLREWAKTSTVSLRLRSEERCSFLREESREVENPTRSVDELSVGGVVKAAVTSKVVTTVTEYLWKLEVSYELLAVRGVGEQPAERLPILARSSHDELKTPSKSAPRPEAKVPAFQDDVNVSWLLRQLPADTLSLAFKVDRDRVECHTPRRNPDVEAAQTHFRGLSAWARRSAVYLQGLLRVQPDPSRRLDMQALSANLPVVSVLPLLQGESSGPGPAAAPEEGQAAAAAAVQEPDTSGVLACLSPGVGPQGMLLSVPDANRLLAEEARALAEKCKALAEAFPAGDTVASAEEAKLVVVLMHCGEVCGQWEAAVDYIEGLLRKQLIAAIGKKVSPADFAEYMRFHNRKLFAEEYLPIPFCFAVRRSEVHAPEGTVSIEQEPVGAGGDSSVAAPIVTLAARSAAAHPMQFPLSASTNVRFGGERYLHAFLSHQFSNQSGAKMSLVARARQFSSMLVLVGRIASASTFEPKHAAIVQNKDEITIPLSMSTIPTPKEFKDAIESLSPEQQAFAKAFRAMQLESTLFGILVVQIKPQLEKVLNLPADCLTKEIKLTQDLMQLFIKYQIPSDLLSFDDGCAGLEGVEIVAQTPSEKLEAVKRHVKAMQEMIDKSKEEEVAERRMERDYAVPRAATPPMDDLDMGLEEARPRVMKKGMSLGKKMAEGSEFRGVRSMMMGAMPPPPACAAAGPPPPPPPAAAAAPPPAQQPPEVPRRAPQGVEAEAKAAEGTAVDYTQVPREMDKQFERLDTDSALRPTIISPGDTWTKRAQKALLASPTTSTLRADDQKREKDAAFDLLDALTKSGALTVDHAALHVVVAATHCFDKSVTETVIQDNTNPIDKVERSTLIMAATVHQKPAAALIRQSQYQRVSATSPMLFVEDGSA